MTRVHDQLGVSWQDCQLLSTRPVLVTATLVKNHKQSLPGPPFTLLFPMGIQGVPTLLCFVLFFFFQTAVPIYTLPPPEIEWRLNQTLIFFLFIIIYWFVFIFFSHFLTQAFLASNRVHLTVTPVRWQYKTYRDTATPLPHIRRSITTFKTWLLLIDVIMNYGSKAQQCFLFLTACLRGVSSLRGFFGSQGSWYRLLITGLGLGLPAPGAAPKHKLLPTVWPASPQAVLLVEIKRQNSKAFWKKL